MGVRQDVADAIAAQMNGTAVLDSVNVYAAPHDAPTLPAVLIEGAEPYIEPITFGQAVRWAFVVHLIVRRTDPASAYDRIEEIRSAIAAGINTVPGSTWGAMTSPGPLVLNDTEMVTAALGVTVETTETE